ncbi:hypothetical protein Gogos_003546 [Gossypium gossypioides]|uniref:Uncharacterized protein n=1 Tax=Gossypium gossypioides TaxID=34282 RepID=A0A7J9CMX1_GOSGO|nr:hypothetical protein [Gossypium gossypioides]
MWNPRLTQTNQAARLMLKLDPMDARFMSHKGGNQMGLAIMVRYRLGEPNLKMMKRVRESGMAMAMVSDLRAFMNGDDSVDRKLENETMAAFVQTLHQQIVSSYFELFWYSIRNFRTINFKQI